MEQNILLDADGNKVSGIKINSEISNKIIFGAHNCFTYLKPKNFWHYFCIPIGRCQNKTFCQQIEAGIRLFDIRVRFNSTGTNIILCHGLFETKTYFKTYKDFITALFEDVHFYKLMGYDINQCIFRLVLEKLSEDILQELYFKNFCKYFSEYMSEFNQKYGTNHKINACVRKYDWKQLYSDSNIINLRELQHISSYPKYPETIKIRWYERIFPWLYAKRTNKIMKENYTMGVYKNYDVVSYDFI